MQDQEKLLADKITIITDKNNLVGLEFGKWKVLVKLEGGTYAVECSCGFQSVKKGHMLVYQRTKQCFRCRIKERNRIRQINIDLCLGYSDRGK